MIRKVGTGFPSRQTRSVCPEIMLKQKDRAGSRFEEKSSRSRDLPRRSWLRWCGDTCEQNGKNAGEKNAVEGPRAADRGDRSAKTGDLVEIEKIGANESPH